MLSHLPHSSLNSSSPCTTSACESYFSILILYAGEKGPALHIQAWLLPYSKEEAEAQKTAAGKVAADAKAPVEAGTELSKGLSSLSLDQKNNPTQRLTTKGILRLAAQAPRLRPPQVQLKA
jgi:hypothetical protein